MVETKLGYQCLIVCLIGVLYYELRGLASMYVLLEVLTDPYTDLSSLLLSLGREQKCLSHALRA
jgi:hypothetical protein